MKPEASKSGSLASPLLLCLVMALPAQGNVKLRDALGDKVSADWIYEDIGAGYAAAKKTGKPLLVTFR